MSESLVELLDEHLPENSVVRDAFCICGAEPPWAAHVAGLVVALRTSNSDDRSIYLTDANGTVYLAEPVVGARPYAPVYTLTEVEAEEEHTE